VFLRFLGAAAPWKATKVGTAIPVSGNDKAQRNLCIKQPSSNQDKISA
jgi:hypothetical protein